MFLKEMLKKLHTLVCSHRRHFIFLIVLLFSQISFAQSLRITNPEFEDKFRQTEIIPISWSSSGIDHYELSYTTDPS